MPEEDRNIIATNREAHFHYQLFDRFEAGIVLRGPEVKSLREGKANLKDSFVRLMSGEAYVFNLHISPYPYAAEELEPTRTRKLLLNKPEIKRLVGEISRKGFTCIPTKLYFKNGRAKLEIAIGQGKKLHDKRETLKKRVHEREMARAMKRRSKRS